MPQSKWERGFWASVRGKGGFTPYPPEHWRKTLKKAGKKKKTVKKRHKRPTRRKMAPEAPQLTFF